VEEELTAQANFDHRSLQALLHLLTLLVLGSKSSRLISDRRCAPSETSLQVFQHREWIYVIEAELLANVW